MNVLRRRDAIADAADRGRLRRFVYAFLAAALAYAAVEMWVTEIVRRVAFPKVFVASPRAFTLALVVSYAALAVVLALIASAIEHFRSADVRPLATAVLTAVLGINAAIHIRLSLLPLLFASIALCAVSVAALVLEEFPPRLRFLTSPWIASALILIPDWFLNDRFLGRSFLFRFIVCGVSALITLAAAFAVARVFARAVRSAAIIEAFVIVASIVVTLSLRPRAEPELPAPAAAPPTAAPNVLLVTLDTVRADHLSLYGYGRDTSPALRRFAETATVFDRAIAPSNMTLTSHASLFTGLYASVHGAHPEADRAIGVPLPKGVPTLAEVFRRRGYDVSSVVANYTYLGRDFGLDRGFSYLFASLPPRATASLDRSSSYSPLPPASATPARKDQLLRYVLWRALRRIVPEFADIGDRTHAADITAIALQRIDHATAAHRPFFLFVNYLDAHAPYLPPAPFDKRFPGRDPQVDAEVRAENTFPIWPSVSFRDPNLSDAQRADLTARYDGAIAYVDASVGRLLEDLQRRGVLRNTVVVITADHGEAFGEHGTVGHGASTYAEEVHVPLVVRMPGQNRADRIAAPISLVDLFPFLSSASTTPLVSSEEIISEAFPLIAPPRRGWWHDHRGRSVVQGDYKLIRSTRGVIQLYDIRQDPAETRDLAAAEPALVARLSTVLDRWIAAHPARFTAPRQELPFEAVQRLRALGYLR